MATTQQWQNRENRLNNNIQKGRRTIHTSLYIITTIAIMTTLYSITTRNIELFIRIYSPTTILTAISGYTIINRTWQK